MSIIYLLIIEGVNYIYSLISDSNKRKGAESCQAPVINQERSVVIVEVLTAFTV